MNFYKFIILRHDLPRKCYIFIFSLFSKMNFFGLRSGTLGTLGTLSKLF